MTIPDKIYRTLYVVYFLLYHFKVKNIVRKDTFQDKKKEDLQYRIFILFINNSTL